MEPQWKTPNGTLKKNPPTTKPQDTQKRKALNKISSRAFDISKPAIKILSLFTERIYWQVDSIVIFVNTGT